MGHVAGPNQVRRALKSNQIDFCFSVTEHVNMSRHVIIDVDDDAQALGTQHGNHVSE